MASHNQSKLSRILASKQYYHSTRSSTDAKHSGAGAHVPRYLFRGYSHLSGGNEQLNNEIAITPLFFLGRNLEDHLLEHWSERQLIDCLKDHFVTVRGGFETRFSSWTASFRSACTYGYSSSACFISILDTHKLPQHAHLFYVPHLLPEQPPWLSGDEYVAYGIVPSSAYRAISYQSLMQAGLANFLQPIKTTAARLEQLQVDMRVAKQIGLLYGVDFALPVATAVFCLSERNEAAGFNNEDLKTVLHVLASPPRSISIPEQFARETFTTDSEFMYHETFLEITRWIEFSQCLRTASSGTSIYKRTSRL